MKSFLIAISTVLAVVSMPAQATPVSATSLSSVTANASFSIDKLIETKKKGKKGHKKHKKA